MQKILVSACLMGEPLRYDGRDNRLVHPVLEQWLADGRVIALCPETAGGLPTPRPPAEILGDRVITRAGEDLTHAFEKGAMAALNLCQRHGIRMALLAAHSPSCGNDRIHDGHFRGRLIEGAGITARRLQDAGIHVFNPGQIEDAAEHLARIDRSTIT